MERVSALFNCIVRKIWFSSGEKEFAPCGESGEALSGLFTKVLSLHP